MSFFSSVIIKLLEKELAEQTPEIEAAILQFVGQMSKDLIDFVETRMEKHNQPPTKDEHV